MSSGTVPVSLPETSRITAQYETLRAAALGEALPPEARHGLILFLRRGMWGWARALAAVSVPVPSMCSQSWNSTTRWRSSAVVELFAGMVMNNNKRSAQ